MNAHDRRGFTLIELLVVSVVGFIVVMTAYQVLATNLQAYSAINLKVQSQQTVRAGMEVLFSELREVSPGGGDLLAMGPDAVSFRSMRTFGVVCAVGASLSPARLTVRRTGRWVRPGDSVVFLADNDEDLSSDDVWISARAESVDTTATCPSGDTAQVVTIAGMGGPMTADTVRPGAPIRAYTQYSYELRYVEGGWYLTRAERGGTPEPMVGPLRSSAEQGFHIDFLDANGATTMVSTDVAQFRIRIRSAPGTAVAGGSPISDSRVTRVSARN